MSGPTLRSLATAGVMMPLLPVRLVGFLGVRALRHLTEGSIENAALALDEDTRTIRDVEGRLEALALPLPRTTAVS